MRIRWIAGAIALAFLWSPLAFAQDVPQGDAEGGWHQHWQNRGEWHQKMCTERYAQKAARLAYLDAKLALTDQQRPAWNKWRQIKLDAAEQRRSACLQHQAKEGATPTAPDREARMEKFLSARLAQLQASKPALQALYDTLSPEQKTLFDQATAWHGHRRHHHGYWHGGHGWQGQEQEQRDGRL